MKLLPSSVFVCNLDIPIRQIMPRVIIVSIALHDRNLIEHAILARQVTAYPSNAPEETKSEKTKSYIAP